MMYCQPSVRGISKLWLSDPFVLAKNCWNLRSSSTKWSKFKKIVCAHDSQNLTCRPELLESTAIKPLVPNYETTHACHCLFSHQSSSPSPSHSLKVNDDGSVREVYHLKSSRGISGLYAFFEIANYSIQSVGLIDLPKAMSCRTWWQGTRLDPVQGCSFRLISHTWSTCTRLLSTLSEFQRYYIRDFWHTCHPGPDVDSNFRLNCYGTSDLKSESGGASSFEWNSASSTTLNLLLVVQI